MKILSMHATFGKLDNQSLTLQPGLNVIPAPNEWGKSTWCAFIIAMLYGIDTRERSTLTTLADKEHYAPWSGKPMAGRMDILWNGRKITLERSSKGRLLFSVFQAYETETGLPVPELTAENCGLTLLGVEKNVFARAGFIRQSEMPVTDDLALRRRLNALVTTGDESGASDKLAQKLKDLKNQCRHNKTGLLPQAENQREQLAVKLEQLSAAKVQITQIEQRQEALQTQLQQLENHEAALSYESAKQNNARVVAAKEAHAQALANVRTLESRCEDLPAEEFAQKKLQQAQTLQSRWAQLQNKPLPQIPETPDAFTGIDPEAASARAQQDKAAFDALQKPGAPLFILLTALCLAIGVGLLFVHPGLILLGIAGAVAFGFLHWRSVSGRKQKRSQLTARYGTLPATQWLETAERYRSAADAYQTTAQSYNREKKSLQDDTEAITGGQSLQTVLDTYQDILQAWQALHTARQEAAQAGSYADALSAMAQQVLPPQAEDTLTLTAQQTSHRIQDIRWEQQSLQKQLGQCMGQIQTIGSEEALRQQLAQVQTRIGKLEDTYAALTIAQETLAEAANELQRRFAPKIAQKAQALFAAMTDGRYDRLILDQDLSLRTGAEGEQTLHSALWRSDGTVDQLYLSLRLAVSEALTPEAPLVLDDALVRFDNTRLANAMTLLKQASDSKQVILFTCHDREEAFA